MAVKDYRLALTTFALVAGLVILRWILFALGMEGMKLTALASSIIGGGVFVMGLVVAGTLSDYKDAERAPTDLASGLYAILREADAMNQVWGAPDMPLMRERLVEVVNTLRRDIAAGNTRECQQAIEDLSKSFHELDVSDAPPNYIARLRGEQAGLRKAVLRVYHIQREEFLPSAYAMIVSFVAMILVLLMFTRIEGVIETLVTVGFLSFFFLYLLRLLNVINKPFKIGQERGEDDVSLFLLYEFVVHAQADGEVSSEAVVAIAEAIEAQEMTDEVIVDEGGEAGGDAEEHVKDLTDVIADAVDAVADDVDVPDGLDTVVDPAATPPGSPAR